MNVVKKPPEQIRLKDIISPAFREFWVASREKRYLHYVLKGGRASGKSFHIPLRVLTDIMEYPVSALALRKVQVTIRKSVFQQFEEAANVLGVAHLFRFVPSLLEITYIPRGNKIYFSGADDPEKLKSLKDAKFPVAIAYFEELAEFKTEQEVTTILNSVLRAEIRGKIKSDFGRNGNIFDYSFYYSYNPPRRKQSWLNEKYEAPILPANTYVHHSTYLDNPFLSKQFIQEAEAVQERNKRKYDWEYMGMPIGSGAQPFENIEFRTITDEEINVFDNIKQGLDFGFSSDPAAFTRWHYDRKRRILYALDEIYGVQIGNRQMAQEIKSRGYGRVHTFGDSAEPKSIDELKRDHGLNVSGASKGPGSVEHGIKWLGELDKIVIDARRTPNIAREFKAIDWKVDKDGNTLPRLVETGDHTIDSGRYALIEEMRIGGTDLLDRFKKR